MNHRYVQNIDECNSYAETEHLLDYVTRLALKYGKQFITQAVNEWIFGLSTKSRNSLALRCSLIRYLRYLDYNKPPESHHLCEESTLTEDEDEEVEKTD